MAGFIDTMRAEGYAVWSICRVLREQGCQVAARTYRAWRRAAPAVRTITETQVIDAVRSAVWTADARGRRKMTALLRRTMVPGVSTGSVDRPGAGPADCRVFAAIKAAGPRSRRRMANALATCSIARTTARWRSGRAKGLAVHSRRF